MNQGNHAISVRLTKENNEDVLKFEFENKLIINFLKSDNNDIKEVFKEILQNLTIQKFKFELVIDEDYDVELYKDVSEVYIKGINEEIEELINSEEWKELYG